MLDRSALASGGRLRPTRDGVVSVPWFILGDVTNGRLGQTRQRPAGAPTTSEYGVLARNLQDFTLRRLPVAPDLDPWIERHWVVTWDLPAGRTSTVTLLPHPCVNVVFAAGALMVAGVGRKLFTYPLDGRGQVYGVKFRPGGFHPFLGTPVSRLTERTVPVGAEDLGPVWGPAALELQDTLAAVGSAAGRPGTSSTSVRGGHRGSAGSTLDIAGMVRAVEEYLRQHQPRPDPQVELVGQIARALLADRSIMRVEDVTRRFGLSTRTLQRLFARHVGVSPKWMLSRYRLHLAAARLADGGDGVDGRGAGTLAEVAADLGYFDQSHFIRDFTRAIGMTPAEYAAGCALGRVPLSA